MYGGQAFGRIYFCVQKPATTVSSVCGGYFVCWLAHTAHALHSEIKHVCSRGGLRHCRLQQQCFNGSQSVDRVRDRSSMVDHSIGSIGGVLCSREWDYFCVAAASPLRAFAGSTLTSHAFPPLVFATVSWPSKVAAQPKVGQSSILKLEKTS